MAANEEENMIPSTASGGSQARQRVIGHLRPRLRPHRLLGALVFGTQQRDGGIGTTRARDVTRVTDHDEAVLDDLASCRVKSRDGVVGASACVGGDVTGPSSSTSNRSLSAPEASGRDHPRRTRKAPALEKSSPQ
jgi:hypothetical protein